ncbi:hypothetical protein ACLMJK_004625 [Lecanora helva]
MNRFRSRKKSPGDKTPDGSRRPSVETDVPPLPSSFASRTFKRKKQAPPEPKPELDLASALPASDDFRTSLLMPKLSARFSMLKEQDDPKSMLGKANDDSVLFPKRASRLDLFNRPGLSDIAEVDSIHGSVRPPFAQTRADSYGSGGYDTDEGSVMSRARPGEGNTMFGGRQKIYKIPVNGSGSVKNFGASEDGELPSGGNMGGKALYESDIAMSAFQKLREEEKRQAREGADERSMRSSKEDDRTGSPPLAKYNRNRETSSSTNSGPSQSRSSTAATSVASQKSFYGAHEAINGTSQPSNPDRPVPKGRRLYGQGLDQHMYEQQSSALHRLESLHRARTPNGAPLSRNLTQSRSATNLNDRYQRGGPLYASSGFRAGSPPPSHTPPRMQDFDLGLPPDETSNDQHPDSGYGSPPPMSPSHDLVAADPTLVAALEPNDLGKATASGAFNKPKKQYDEQQYLQRQLALQEGRGTPSPQLVRPFSPHAFSTDKQIPGRSRNSSIGSNFSRTNSFRQPWEHHMEDRVLRAVPESASPPAAHKRVNRNEQSFFTGMSESDVNSESETDPNSPIPSSSQPHDFPQSLPYPQHPLSEHADAHIDSNHLQSPSEENSSDSRSYRSGTTITQRRSNPSQERNKDAAFEADSPTLGPSGVTNGLSGLVHQHLRNDSNTSSIYPEESSHIHPNEVRDSIFGHASALTHSRQQSRDDAQVNGDSWVDDRQSLDRNDVDAPAPLSFAARHILEQATALRNNQINSKAQQTLGEDKAQRILGGEAPRSSHSRSPSTSWQEQLKAHHARVGSTETQQEREDLANELAERRRMVQDNLKNYVEVDERMTPQGRTRDNSPAKLTPPFGILKKSSRGSLVGKSERPAKAMKMLGIGPAGSAPTKIPEPQRPPPDLFVGQDQLSDRAMPPKQMYPPQPIRRPQDLPPNPAHPPTFKREPDSYGSQDNLTRKASPRSSQSGSSYSDKSDRRSPGSRKNSNATVASAERGRVNGAGPGLMPESRPPTSNAPRPTDELMASMARHGGPNTERSQSAMSGRMRSRSNSKTAAAPSYPGPRMAPPGTPYMLNPSPSSTRSNPFSHQPASSNNNDPRPSISSAPSFPPPQRSPTRPFHSRPGARGGVNTRKQSINKNDISEPTFITCTSTVDTINLPEGASLANGMDEREPRESSAPPIPARDARRKRTQTLLQALGRGAGEKAESSPSSPVKTEMHGGNGFSATADEEQATYKSLRQRLRKTSSEGGSMAVKARLQQQQLTSPAVPHFEQSQVAGDHLPYQEKQNVPASAVMF